MPTDKSKIFFWVCIIVISVVCFASIYLFRPIIDGDGLSYVTAMHVLQGGSAPIAFVPNRILNTFLSLESVIFFSKIFGSLETGWLILNIGFYFLLNALFYRLVLRIFKSDATAFLATLFLASNYAMISFGLDYWMDIGAWMFYIASLYFTLKYVETHSRKLLLYSAALVGIGGLFKEYAFLGVIPIAIMLIYENWPHLVQTVKRGLIPGLLAIVPIGAVYVYVFSRFGYTYADWFSFNNSYAATHYVYSSKIVEYVKSFGSLYTFLAFLVIGGAYYVIRNRKELVPEKETRVFLLSVVVSCLPVFMWPGITQRILFITVPAAILVASFLSKKYEKYWWAFLPILALYVLAGFTMNAYILPNFNLPI